MSRTARHIQRRRRVVPLAGFGDLTQSRSSVASDGVPVDANGDGIGRTTATVNHFAANKAVVSRFRGHTWILSTPQYVQRCLQSENMGTSPWSSSGGTLTEDQATAPDGTLLDADYVAATAATDDPCIQDVTVDDSKRVFGSVYAKAVSGETPGCRVWIRAKNGTTVETDITPTDEWKRYQTAVQNTSTGATQPQIRIRGNSGHGGGTESGHIWGVTYIQNPTVGEQFNLPYVPSTTGTVTKTVDNHRWAAGGTKYNQDVLTKPWAFGFIPLHDHDGDDGTTNAIFAFDDSSTAKMRVYWNGGTAKFDVLNDAQTTVVSSNALTYSAGQVIWVILDPANGTIEVIGATTGDGKVTGTAWTVGGDYTLGIGYNPTSGGGACSGWVSFPFYPRGL